MNERSRASSPAVSESLLSRKLPPIAELAVLSIALMLIGGVYLGAHLPKPPPLGPPLGLVVVGGVISVADMILLSRIRPFAWHSFFLVLRWALLAYLVIAGLLVFVFVRNDVRGSTLAILIATIVVFAIDVPMVLAFTVARFQPYEAAETARTTLIGRET
jgi:hypothetical protein